MWRYGSTYRVPSETYNTSTPGTPALAFWKLASKPILTCMHRTVASLYHRSTDMQAMRKGAELNMPQRTPGAARYSKQRTPFAHAKREQGSMFGSGIF